MEDGFLRKALEFLWKALERGMSQENGERQLIVRTAIDMSLSARSGHLGLHNLVATHIELINNNRPQPHEELRSK